MVRYFINTPNVSVSSKGIAYSTSGDCSMYVCSFCICCWVVSALSFMYQTCCLYHAFPLRNSSMRFLDLASSSSCCSCLRIMIIESTRRRCSL